MSAAADRDREKTTAELLATRAETAAVNAYVVRTRDERTYTEPVMDDGSGPQIPYLPIAPVVAETPGQAKRVFLTEFTRRPGSGVYGDDWNELRVRLLLRDVDVAAGIHEESHEFWLRIHELEDHDGRPCDCPELWTQIP